MTNWWEMVLGGWIVDLDIESIYCLMASKDKENACDGQQASDCSHSKNNQIRHLMTFDFWYKKFKDQFLVCYVSQCFQNYFSPGVNQCFGVYQQLVEASKSCWPPFIFPFVQFLFFSFCFLMEKYLKILEKFISTNKSCLYVFFT